MEMLYVERSLLYVSSVIVSGGLFVGSPFSMAEMTLFMVLNAT